MIGGSGQGWRSSSVYSNPAYNNTPGFLPPQHSYLVPAPNYPWRLQQATMIPLPGGLFVDNFGRGWRRSFVWPAYGSFHHLYGYLVPAHNYLWKLQPEQIEAMGLRYMEDSWFDALCEEFQKEYFVQLSKKVAEDRKPGRSHEVYPAAEDVFNWTRYCAINEVKMVILGQDPYPDHRACGLAFSVKGGDTRSTSLTNIFNEIAREGFRRPIDGDLTRWAKEGVVLLNTVLTYREDKHVTRTGEVKTFNAHMKQGWETFTDEVIRCISSHNTGVVFMLWGVPAKEKACLIDQGRNHLILESSHPSRPYNGFSGCGHFFKANGHLEKQGKTPINW